MKYFIVIVYCSILVVGCQSGPKKNNDAKFSIDEIRELLNPPLLEECHNENKLFDRKNNTCFENARIAPIDCNQVEVFKMLQSRAEDAYVALVVLNDQGYKIDQCGIMNDGNPVVFFYKRYEGETKLELDIKMITTMKKQ
jgi:hypothetical protein